MDAMTMLSIASSVMQSADYASKLLSQSRQLYKSPHGSLTEPIDVERIMEDLALLSDRLSRGSTGSAATEGDGSVCLYNSTHRPQNDKEISMLRSECIAALSVLRDRLSTLNNTEMAPEKGSGSSLGRLDKWQMMLGAVSTPSDSKRPQFRNWACFRQALIAIWNNEDMAVLASKIWKIQSEIQYRLLVAFRIALNSGAAHHPQTSHDLKKSTKLFIDTFHSSYEALATQIQIEAIRIIENDSQSNNDDSSLDIALGDESHRIGTLHSQTDVQDLKRRSIQDPRIEREIHLLITENCVLRSLAFATMMDRRESVERAHEATFDWIYSHEIAGTPWSSFVNWLRIGSGIYWINGKVGAGKSTLMRYLYDHDTTRTELGRCVDDLPCEVYGFFFLNSGDEYQKSHTGLLRSLLFETLQRHRNILPRVMSDCWDAWSGQTKLALSSKLPDGGAFAVNDVPQLNFNQLQNAFRKLLRLLGNTTRLCFFIDGLDEFGGDYTDIIAMLKQYSKYPNVKLCVSSRPVQEFEKSFAGLPTLRLQDLTQADINRYIYDGLHQHIAMVQLSEEHGESVGSLIEEVAEKSQGVFLWAKLAVRLLTQDLLKCSGLSDLQRHARLLPGELEQLYMYMISHSDETELKHASQIFQIFQTARTCGLQRPTLLQLSWADDEDEALAEEAVIEAITPEEIHLRCHEMDRVLKDVCAGLLESGDMQFSSIAPNAKVAFLHRTVSDWIAKPEVWDELVSRTTNTGFNASLSLLKSCILRVKTMNANPNKPLDMDAASDAFKYAKTVESELGVAVSTLMDQLDLAASYQWRLADCNSEYKGDDMSDTSDDTVVAERDDCEMDGTPTQPATIMSTVSESFVEYGDGFFDVFESAMEMSATSTDVAIFSPKPARTPHGGGQTLPGTPSITHSYAQPSRSSQSVGGQIGNNELAASYMAHTEARNGWAGREERLPAARPRRRVGHLWHHWTFGLEIPGAKDIAKPSTFLDAARLAGLDRYVAAKDASANVQDQDVSVHMLMRAVAPPSGFKSGETVNAELVDELLSGGANPNFAYLGQTPWEMALTSAASQFAAAVLKASDPRLFRESLGPVYKAWFRVVTVFLRHEANPYAVAKVEDVTGRPVVSLTEILTLYVPDSMEDEAVNILQLLRERCALADKRAGKRKAKVERINLQSEMLSSTPSMAIPWGATR